jgi:acyl dehydratase
VVSHFTVPSNQRYFEDYVQGEVFEFGPIAVDEAEIIAFAQRFDPQTMHTSPKEAAQGPFKGLIASGWHTIGLMMRLFVDHYLSSVASLASPGWPRPVRPGDQLRVRISILEARPSRSKPDRGMIRSLIEGLNQNGEVVASFSAMNLLLRRLPGD